MTLATNRVREIFADARELHADALEMLELGKIRNAAEKAWGATKRATDAMILARTGHEPRTSGITYRSIRRMRHETEAMENLANRYSQRMQDLHGACFYDGIVEPEEPITNDIRATSQYIQDAKTLAGI